MKMYDPKGVYTPAEVRAALEGSSGVRAISFRFERLSVDNVVLEDMKYVADGSVSNNMFADIKRTAKFTIKDGGGLNYLSDRIKPYVRIEMANGGFVEWPQGVFLLSTPSRSYVSGAAVFREVDGYDQLLVLRDDKVADRYAVLGGATYTTAITNLLTGMGLGINMTPSTLTLPSTVEWEPGTSRLAILNALLSAINYESAFFNEDGLLICRPYQAPSSRTAEYSYATDKTSIISGDVTQTLDLFSIPNKWVLVVSNPDDAPLSASFTNTSLSSPTSTVSRGRTIVDFRTGEAAADLATLQAKVERLAFNSSQVYEVVEFKSALMPAHQNADVYTVTIDGLDIGANYSETAWTMPLKAGELMAHTARRIVTIA